MNQPPFNFHGITVFEPVTVLTDFILCVFCLFFAHKMHKQDTKIWSLFFVSMAVATCAGALGHGMYDHEKSDMKMISSVFGIISVFLASITSAKLIFHENFKKIVTTVICLELVTFLFLIAQNNDIKIVAINGTMGFLFIVAPIHLNPVIRKNSGSKLILYGICVNGIAGVVHCFTLSPHKWFNHNDLSHLVMLFGLYLFAKGAIQLKLEESQLIESLAEVKSAS
jgi:hypothetical protein